MRGARELFHEYILELHGRIGLVLCQSISRQISGILVGHDGGMHVIAGKYHHIWRSKRYIMIVLNEAGGVSRL